MVECAGSNTVSLSLDWETRLRIALEAAKGLEYLHEHVNPPVIHRDFKSSNILLDRNLHAKVSDFGLAKLGPDKAGGHVSTRVLGTQGYIAPEYDLITLITFSLHKALLIYLLFREAKTKLYYSSANSVFLFSSTSTKK